MRSDEIAALRDAVNRAYRKRLTLPMEERGPLTAQICDLQERIRAAMWRAESDEGGGDNG